MAMLPLMEAMASRPMERCWIEPAGVCVTKVEDVARTVTETKFLEPKPEEVNVRPEDRLAAEVRAAVTPVESLTRLMAVAISAAVVPERNLSSCTPSEPVTSSVTDVVTADCLKELEDRGLRSCSTLTATGMLPAVPKETPLDLLHVVQAVS